MIDLTEEQKQSFYSSGYFRRYSFYFPEINLRIEGDMVYQESVSIRESICEGDEMYLGGCIASSCEFETADIEGYDLNGLTFNAILDTWRENTDIPQEDNPDDTDKALGEHIMTLPMGTYRVNSAKRVDDKDYRRVVGYDYLYDMSTDVTDWYNTILPDTNTWVYLKYFREQLLEHLGIPYEVQDNLVNNFAIVTRTVDTGTQTIKGIDALKYACELSAGFGKIGRNGRFRVYTFNDVNVGLYPDSSIYPSNNIYPNDSSEDSGLSEESPDYISVDYEEYKVSPITAIVFKTNTETEDSTQSITVGSDTSNPYVISENFLLWKKNEPDVTSIGNAMLSALKDITYTPAVTELQGLPYVEPGDSYSLIKRNDIVKSFVFSRTLSGVQALRDNFETHGEKLRTNVEADTTITELEEDTEEEKENEEIQDLKAKWEVLDDMIQGTVGAIGNSWDTKGYNISFFGFGEPDIEYEDLAEGDLYLDQDTGQIWEFMPYKMVIPYKENTEPTIEYAYNKKIKPGSLYMDTSTMFIYVLNRAVVDSPGVTSGFDWYNYGNPEEDGFFSEKIRETYDSESGHTVVIPGGKVITNTDKDYVVAYSCLDLSSDNGIFYTLTIRYLKKESGYYGAAFIYGKSKNNEFWKKVNSGWKIIKQCESVEEILTTRYTQTAEAIELEARRAKDEENYLKSQISVTAEEIALEVARSQNAEESIYSRLTMTEKSIMSEVARSTNAENALSSRVEQTESSWAMTLRKNDDVITAINASHEGIELKGNRLWVESTNFTLDKDGNATFSGDITGATGNFAGNLTAGLTTFGALQNSIKSILIGATSSNGIELREVDASFGTFTPAIRLCNSTGGIITQYDEDSISHNRISIIEYGESSQLFGNPSGSSARTTYLRGDIVRLYSHQSGAVYLGSSGSTAVISDENMKDLYELDNRYETFFNNLTPVLYIYKDTEKNKHYRKHIGFGAQSVEKALKSADLDTKDFAGILIDKDVTITADEAGTEEDVHYDEMYSLRYEEFIALNTAMIQKAMKRIDELEKTVSELQQEIRQLKSERGE